MAYEERRCGTAGHTVTKTAPVSRSRGSVLIASRRRRSGITIDLALQTFLGSCTRLSTFPVTNASSEHHTSEAHGIDLLSGSRGGRRGVSSDS
jgi:hypothetical protein